MLNDADFEAFKATVSVKWSKDWAGDLLEAAFPPTFSLSGEIGPVHLSPAEMDALLAATDE